LSTRLRLIDDRVFDTGHRRCGQGDQPGQFGAGRSLGDIEGSDVIVDGIAIFELRGGRRGPSGCSDWHLEVKVSHDGLKWGWRHDNVAVCGICGLSGRSS
jgi:hypothetical protein